MALRRGIDDQRGVARSVFTVGLVYQNRATGDDDKLGKAFECFQEAYRVAAECGHQQERAEAARHMAHCYGVRGEHDRALFHHREFVSISEELGLKHWLPPGHVMVGFAYLARNDLGEAMQHFQKARALAEEMDFKRNLAESLFGIGVVREAEGDPRAALDCFRQAQAVAEQIGFRRVADLTAWKIEELSGKQGT